MRPGYGRISPINNPSPALPSGMQPVSESAGDRSHGLNPSMKKRDGNHESPDTRDPFPADLISCRPYGNPCDRPVFRCLDGIIPCRDIPFVPCPHPLLLHEMSVQERGLRACHPGQTYPVFPSPCGRALYLPGQDRGCCPDSNHDRLSPVLAACVPCLFLPVCSPLPDCCR